MKRMVFLLAVVLSIGLVANAEAVPDKTHKATAQIVAVDPENKTITIKAEDGTDKVVPVEGKAAEMLKDLKAGDTVELTCRDNDKGEHQAVSEIAKAPAPEKKPEPKPKH